MADNKNMQLSDDMFAGVTGGFTSSEKATDYDAIGKVVMTLGDKKYMVRFDDGGEVIATPDKGETVTEGSKVGLFAVAGGWTMRVI